MKKFIIPVGGALIAVIVAVAFITLSGGGRSQTMLSSQIEKPAGRVEVGSLTPNFTLNDFSGKQVTLSQFLGKPVVINFWASWCPFCIGEMPDFEKVYQENEGKVVFLGIHRTATESLEAGKEFGEPLVSYPLLADTKDEVYKTLTGGQPAMPFTLIVDRQGKVAFRKFGPLTIEELREQVQKVI